MSGTPCIQNNLGPKMVKQPTNIGKASRKLLFSWSTRHGPKFCLTAPLCIIIVWPCFFNNIHEIPSNFYVFFPNLYLFMMQISFYDLTRGYGYQIFFVPKTKMFVHTYYRHLLVLFRLASCQPGSCPPRLIASRNNKGRHTASASGLHLLLKVTCFR